MNTTALRKVLYTLQHRFGQEGYVYTQTSDGVDRKTGIEDLDVSSIVIPKMIILPRMMQLAVFDLLRELVSRTGGEFEQNDREIIIENDGSLKLTTTNYIVVKGQRYNILRIEDYDVFYLLHGRLVQHEEGMQVVTEYVNELVQTAEGINVT